MGTWVAFTFGLLWIMLWMWVYKSLSEFLLSIPLAVYPEARSYDNSTF